MKKKWYKEGFVYQIYPISFCDSNGDGYGDLNGITSKVSYLKELGVSTIWLSPIYDSPMVDMGYDISDYKRINPMFGTMDDFDLMLKTYHDNNIRVVMDLVVNHTSNKHKWFIEALKGKDNPYHDYYFFKNKPNNWNSFFETKAWEYVPSLDEYYLHLFTPEQPDLNWDNPKVREDVKDILRFWLDKGVDGFRCDVLDLISKPQGLPDSPSQFYFSGDHLHEYIHELYVDVFSKYDCFTVGECGGMTSERALSLVSDEREELNMVFQFNHFSLDADGPKWNIKEFPFHMMKEKLDPWQYELYPKGWPTLVLGNHDQPRYVSRYGDLNYRKETAKLYAMFMYLQIGTPFMYQGEEIGMTNYPFKSIEDFKDVESINIYNKGLNECGLSNDDMINRLCYIARDNARTPMQWNDDNNAGFTSGKPWMNVNPNYKDINAKSDRNSKDSIYYFFQKLIKLKGTNETLIYGSYEDLNPSSDEIAIYKRYDNNNIFYIVCNMTNKELFIDLSFIQNNFELVLSNYDIDNNKFLPYQGKVLKVIK